MSTDLVKTLREQLPDDTYRALVQAWRAQRAADEQAGYARALRERAILLRVAATLRGLARSWTAWIGGLLIALPEILPLVQGELPALLGQQAADKVMQICGLLMLLLRLKTTGAVWDKGQAGAGK